MNKIKKYIWKFVKPLLIFSKWLKFYFNFFFNKQLYLEIWSSIKVSLLKRVFYNYVRIKKNTHRMLYCIQSFSKQNWMNTLLRLKKKYCFYWVAYKISYIVYEINFNKAKNWLKRGFVYLKKILRNFLENILKINLKRLWKDLF